MMTASCEPRRGCFRRKLKMYFEHECPHTPQVIIVPKGAYVPVFVPASSPEEPSFPSHQAPCPGRSTPLLCPSRFRRILCQAAISPIACVGLCRSPSSFSSHWPHGRRGCAWTCRDDATAHPSRRVGGSRDGSSSLEDRPNKADCDHFAASKVSLLVVMPRVSLRGCAGVTAGSCWATDMPRMRMPAVSGRVMVLALAGRSRA